MLGTTGVDAARRARFDAAAREAGIPIFHAPNFAIGAVLAMRFAAEAARHLPRVEIVELHSEHKLDRPSGTAAATAERITARDRRRGADPLGAPPGPRSRTRRRCSPVPASC